MFHVAVLHLQFVCSAAMRVNLIWPILCFLFQMKLLSARWTSWLCLGDICYVTPLSCEYADVMCDCVVVGDWLTACMQLCSDDVMILMLWYVFVIFQSKNDQLVTGANVYDWRRVNDWTSAVWLAGWLIDESSLTWLVSVWLLLFLSRMLEFTCTSDAVCVMWS